MLARKHYAQKGNSRGNMNTRPIAGSSSIVINNRLRQQHSNTVKKMEDFTCGKATTLLKQKVMKCSTADNTTTICPSGCQTSSAIGSRKRASNLHKDLIINTQAKYIEETLPGKKVCLENEPKPISTCNNCVC